MKATNTFQWTTKWMFRVIVLGITGLGISWAIEQPAAKTCAQKMWDAGQNALAEIDRMLPWKKTKKNATGVLYLVVPNSGEHLWTQTVELPEGLLLKEEQMSITAPREGHTLLAIQGYIEVRNDFVEDHYHEKLPRFILQ